MYSAVIYFQGYGKSLGVARRTVGKRLNYELEERGRKKLQPNLMQYPDILQEGLEKATVNAPG